LKLRARWLLALALALVLVLVALAGLTFLDRAEEPLDVEASTDLCDTQGPDVRTAGVAFRSATSSAPDSSEEPTPALDDADLELAWSDEFDGGEVDLSSWSTRECWHDRPGFVNDSDAWLPYPATSANLSQADGVLRLKAVEDQVASQQGKVMSTAMLTTRERFDTFTHGVVEARLKVPTGRGLWPAFWLMATARTRAGGPRRARSTSSSS
jgi:beta-glucanase (GH16 family)